jgi:hypothetical protein
MLHWLPSRRTRPDVPAHRDDQRWYTHTYSDRHAQSHSDGHAQFHSDGNAERNGKLDADTWTVYIV